MNDNFSVKEIRSVNKAKGLYKRLGASPLRKFCKQLNKEILVHYNISLKDACRGEFVHGKEVVRLRGKATRSS